MAIIAVISIVIILFVIAEIVKKSKVRDKSIPTSTSDKDKAEAERQRKLQETDELITVVLPVIRNDK